MATTPAKQGTEYVMVRVTSAEKKQLRRKAAAGGYVNVSEYCRDLFRNAHVARTVAAGSRGGDDSGRTAA